MLHRLLWQTPPPLLLPALSDEWARLLDYLKIMSDSNYHYLLNQIWHRKIIKCLNQGILLCHTLGSPSKPMELLLILKMRWKMFYIYLPSISIQHNNECLTVTRCWASENHFWNEHTPSEIDSQKPGIIQSGTDKCSFTWELYFGCLMAQVKMNNFQMNIKIILKKLQMESMYVFSSIHI